jgi:hypothetical protein
MGWVKKPHLCELPLVAHGSVAKVGAWFECDHCKANWKVQARVYADTLGFYRLTFIRRVGDYTYTRSWQEG